jgi:hypothetical protein
MTTAVRQHTPTRVGRSAALTAAASVALAVVAGALLLWGRSYPGYPTSAAALAITFALAALILPLVPRPRRLGTALPLAVVAVVLAVGIGATWAVGDRPLRARWAASAPEFEAYVAQLPAPSTFTPDGFGASFHDFPSDQPCPVSIGTFTLSECWSLDGGYLFLQAPGALTDSSGIAYLPGGNDPDKSGLGSSGLSSLGGPWWSWTCDC